MKSAQTTGRLVPCVLVWGFGDAELISRHKTLDDAREVAGIANAESPDFYYACELTPQLFQTATTTGRVDVDLKGVA